MNMYTCIWDITLQKGMSELHCIWVITFSCLTFHHFEMKIGVLFISEQLNVFEVFDQNYYIGKDPLLNLVHIYSVCI